MGLFEQFPFTNFHEMNLDWIIDEIKKLQKEISTIDTDGESLNGAINLQSYLDANTNDVGIALNSAISKAEPHSTIIIPLGVYATSATVNINKPIRITSPYNGFVYRESNPSFGIDDGRKCIIKSEAASVFNITSPGVEIDHLGIACMGGNNCITINTANSLTGIARYINVHDVGAYSVDGAGGDAITMYDTILSTFRNVYLWGFNNGFLVKKGKYNSTSITFDNTWVQGYTNVGYDIDTCYYTTFSSCAADSDRNGKTAYKLSNCKVITFDGCGCEYTQNEGLIIDSCENISVNIFMLSAGQNAASAIKTTGCQNITFNTCYVDKANAVNADSPVTFINCNFNYYMLSGTNVAISKNSSMQLYSDYEIAYSNGVTNLLTRMSKNSGIANYIGYVNVPSDVSNFSFQFPVDIISYEYGLAIGPTPCFVERLASGVCNVMPLNGSTISPGKYIINIVSQVQ